MPENIPPPPAQNKLLTRIFKISIILCLITFISILFIITYLINNKDQVNNKTLIILKLSFIILALITCLSFFIGIISLIIKTLTSKPHEQSNMVILIIKLVLFFPILPLYLFIILLKLVFLLIKRISQKESELNSENQHLKPYLSKISVLVLIEIILLPIWTISYLITVGLIADKLGYLKEPINISGTGSMFPTFPKGEGKDPKELAKQIVGTPGMIPYPNGLLIGGKRYFGYQITRGDIVVVENDKIREITEKIYGNPAGWVKRVIGLPGDTIELREGIVYLNNQPLKEAYTAKPRSTFGQTFLSECTKITVPKDHLFIMGDNRKASSDSREIGFVKLTDVNHVLPFKNQKDSLDKNWRNTAEDLSQFSKIKLDKFDYLNLLNIKRKENGAEPLVYQLKLEESARKRGEIMIQFNDFSFEATQSGYTMEKAMNDVNYSNIIWGEIPIQGYYEAEELIEAQFQFPEFKKFLTDNKFQEIGITEVEGEINGCPTQIIIQHFAGYVPPNYKKEDIEGWKKVLSRLKEIQPGWAKLKEYKEFYEKNKADVDRINEIIKIRISNISIILSQMENNQWFTKNEQEILKQEEALSQEQERLANKLNNQ